MLHAADAPLFVTLVEEGLMDSIDSKSQTKNRRRIDDGATRGGDITNPPLPRRLTHAPNAATIPDPHQLVGKQLEPIIEILVSQPINLQTHIINKSMLMLEQLANIRQRRESHRRFTKLVIDPSTKEARKDESGRTHKVCTQQRSEQQSDPLIRQIQR